MTSPVDPQPDQTPPSEPAVEPKPVDSVRVARDITRLSVVVAVVLIALKAFALGASGSVSILASLTDSALDLAASLATFYAVRWAAAPADAEHRFGHGKGEAIAALVQSGLIFASAVFIGWEALQRVFDPRPLAAGGWAVGVMLISIGLTAGLVWLQGRALKRAPSLAIAGDRSHYASDLAANIVVLIGLTAGVWLRAPALDAIAGLIVAIWLFWGAISLMRQAADPLLDRTAPEAVNSAITTAVLSDPRIGGLHALRTRVTGRTTHIQMHIDLDPDLSLDQAHTIVVEAENRIHAVVPGADLLIHPDPRPARPLQTTVPHAPNETGPGSEAGNTPDPGTSSDGPWG